MSSSIKFYFFVTGVNIITEEVYSEGSGSFFWRKPCEMMPTTQGTILRPLFAPCDNWNMVPIPETLKKFVLINEIASEGSANHYRKSIEDIVEKIEKAKAEARDAQEKAAEAARLKESGLIIPPQGITVGGLGMPRGKGFKLPS